MEDKIVDFNSLPQAVEYLIKQVEEIKSALHKGRKTVCQNETLDIDGVKLYMEKRKIPMSKSRIYKLSSSGDLDFPVHRIGNRLLFYTKELDEWCKQQINRSDKNINFKFNIKKI